MKYRLFIPILILFVFMASCDDEDENFNGTALVSFSLEELMEVENATIGLSVNIGIDDFNHGGGDIGVSITGGDYGTDYETSTGSADFTLTVEPGGLVAEFSVNLVDDEIIEEDKQLTITLTSASGSLELGENTTLTFTIIDNDNPLIAIVGFANDVTDIQENDANSTTIEIPFDQATTDGGTITITSSGDAVLDTDYTVENQTATDFTISVPAGATSASFNVSPIDNADFEENKSVVFTIEEVTGGLSVGPDAQINVTIINDDSPPNPVIDFDGANALTYNEDAGTISLNLILSDATTADATVEISTSGDADANDFNFGGSNDNPYSFVIPAGSTSASLDITIVDDMDTEADETIALSITSVTGGLDAGLNLQSQTITITDNDFVAPFSYAETFESNDGSVDYLNTVLNFENVIINQTIDNTRDIDLITNGGNFTDINNVGGSSDNGLNIFYNTGNNPALNGVVDNALITPLIEGTGNLTVNIDGAYAFKNQNRVDVTFYWSQTYDGSGTFNEADWTVMGTESVLNMDSEGFGNNSYKRQEFNIQPTANFYVAVRVTGTVDDTFYRFRWRFDNIQVNEQ